MSRAIMAVRESLELYILLDELHLTEITNYLFDNKFKVHQCAIWFFHQKVNEKHKYCFSFDENDFIPLYDFIDNFKT